LYGVGNYSSDESKDASAIIDTDEFRAEMDTELSQLCNRWHETPESGRNSDGSIIPMPKLTLTESFKAFLDSCKVHKRDLVKNIRLWGEASDDYNLPYYRGAF
jgi:hypothetical protein